MEPVRSAMAPVGSATRQAAVWCDRCGGATGEDTHPACAAARALEPPRFCPVCRRRMKVQVLPTGWTATCVEHGEIRC